jgi:hypothetical protein
MDQYYSVFLKRFEKLERPEKIVTIVGALTVTGLVAYCAKRVLFSDDESTTKGKGGQEAIPTPDGAIFYLGTCIYKT